MLSLPRVQTAVYPRCKTTVHKRKAKSLLCWHCIFRLSIYSVLRILFQSFYSDSATYIFRLCLYIRNLQFHYFQHMYTCPGDTVHILRCNQSLNLQQHCFLHLYRYRFHPKIYNHTICQTHLLAGFGQK